MKSSLVCIFLSLSLCTGVSYSQTPVEHFQVPGKGKPVGLKVPAVQRINFAKSFEKRLIARGDKAHVVTKGDSDKILVIKWPELSRPFVQGITNNARMVKDLRELGFKRIMLTDGKKSAWDIDLKN
jgi:hypothetical protein